VLVRVRWGKPKRWVMMKASIPRMTKTCERLDELEQCIEGIQGSGGGDSAGLLVYAFGATSGMILWW